VRALEFWKSVTLDEGNLVERIIALLRQHNISFCVIGGHSVNAYADPVVSLDLDLVVTAEQIERVEALLSDHFDTRRFPRSVNVTIPDSDLRIQIQTDPRYSEFPSRAEERELLGVILPVAQIEDVLKGKVWAVSDPERRPSKRQKDLADISRLLEARPDLRTIVPDEILTRLI
jgi:hypothetical protein